MSTHFEEHESDPVIVSACRTAIGRLRGGLAKVRPDDLLGYAFAEAVRRAGIDPEAIGEAYAGCANQAGEDNRNVARMALLLAGLPEHIPALTVNRLCASGLESVVQAARAIKLGDIHCALTGGVESMSRAPYSMAKAEGPYPVGAPAIFDTALGWRYPNPAMKKIFPLEQMGETAENLVEEYGISREDQDAFALGSHQKAITAIESGWFKDEIFPVSVPQRKGDPLVVDTDEGPRADTSLAQLAKLKAVFREGGSVTAGNSSTLNDGAASLVVTSRSFAEAHGLKIRATLRGWASAGVNPRVMGIGPVPATEKALTRAGLEIGDIDVVELNEAFASQSLAVIRQLGLDEEKVNLHGGAISLGHPLGCSGARILTTLLGAMERTGGTLGLATLCVGVGQGLAVIIER